MRTDSAVSAEDCGTWWCVIRKQISGNEIRGEGAVVRLPNARVLGPDMMLGLAVRTLRTVRQAELVELIPELGGDECMVL